jgi:hypothetical protein
MNKENKAIVSESDLFRAENEPLDFILSFQGEDLSPVNQVQNAEHIVFHLFSFPSESGHQIKINMEGEVTFVSSDGKRKKQKIASEDYLLLEDSEEADLKPNHGLYDLLPALKAIFYASLPLLPIKEKYQKKAAEYEVISEEEYASRKQGNQEEEKENPFAKALKKK